MKVRELMSAVVHTCRAQDTLESAARTLWEHDCGFLPVLDRDGRVGATITDRDICMAAYTRGARLAELRVSEAMSKQLAACGPDDDLEVAVKRMCMHQVRRLPIVDEAGKPCGVLSINDLADQARRDGRFGREPLKVLIAVSRCRAGLPVDAKASVGGAKRADAKTASRSA